MIQGRDRVEWDMEVDRMSKALLMTRRDDVQIQFRAAHGARGMNEKWSLHEKSLEGNIGEHRGELEGRARGRHRKE